ncbi:MAG TPA: hypothetical protein VIJ85_02785 [Rhizomicrobium sp.]
MSANTQADPDLKAVAAMLREQIEQCHDMARGLYDSVCAPHTTRPLQEETMKTLTRLVQASASAASALKRLKGSESRQTITVERDGGGRTGENPKTNSGVPG